MINYFFKLIAASRGFACYLHGFLVTWTQECARGLFSRDRGDTDTLKPETEALTIQGEARPRPRPSELETETRPRRTNSDARPSRVTTAPRDGLETEASRPRPHPCVNALWLSVMCLSCRKNMKNVTSLLLMLVILGVFIQSSQAVRCYDCDHCETPVDIYCSNDVCVTRITSHGGLIRFYFRSRNCTGSCRWRNQMMPKLWKSVYGFRCYRTTKVV